MVRREDAVESREIDAGLRHQGSQTCNEIYWRMAAPIEGHLFCPVPKALAALAGQALPGSDLHAD